MVDSRMALGQYLLEQTPNIGRDRYTPYADALFAALWGQGLNPPSVQQNMQQQALVSNLLSAALQAPQMPRQVVPSIPAYDPALLGRMIANMASQTPRSKGVRA